MPLKDISILIADDHPMYRKGLISSLQSIGVVNGILEADNGEQALKIAAKHYFDLFLFDYKMPDMTGIDLTRKILRKRPVSRIMIISSYAEPELVMQFYRAGAKGYLEKNCGIKEIKQAILEIVNGRMYYHESLQILPPRGKEIKKTKRDIVEFTTRETDLIRLIAKGFNSQQIAEIKDLSLRTIETYRSRLFKKTNVRNTAELLDYFYRNGLL